MGKSSSTTTSTTKLTKAIRPTAKLALGAVRDEFPAAIQAAKDIDLTDPEVLAAIRDEYLKTVSGGYTDSPYVEAQAERASGLAQRGIQGMLRNYGGGAYANAVLDARQRAALDVYGRERGLQFAALGMGPEQYELATAPQRDVYRRRVADPTRLSAGFGAAVGANPLAQESRTKQKTKRPFDWGGFFASLATTALGAVAPGAGGAPSGNQAGAPYPVPGRA